MSRDHSDPPAPSLVTILPALFPSSERVRLGLVLLTSVLVAFFEVVGVASILPFFAILMDPTAVDRYAWLAKMLGALGVAGSTDRILALGVLTAAVIVLSNAASAIGMWSQQWYVARTKTRISVAICDAYLAPPLEYHTKHDAPSLLKVIYNDVEPLSVLLPVACSSWRERWLSSRFSWCSLFRIRPSHSERWRFSAVVMRSFTKLYGRDRRRSARVFPIPLPLERELRRRR